MESLKEPRTISADEHLSQDLASRFPSLQWWVWIFKVPSCSDILCHSDLSRHLKSLAVSSWSTCKRPNIGLRTRDTEAWKEMFLPEPGMPENSGTGTAPDSNAFKLISSTDPSCSLPLSLLNLARLANHRQRRLLCGSSAGSANDSTQTRGPGLSDPAKDVWLLLDCWGEPLKDGSFWSLP